MKFSILIQLIFIGSIATIKARRLTEGERKLHEFGAAVGSMSMSAEESVMLADSAFTPDYGSQHQLGAFMGGLTAEQIDAMIQFTISLYLELFNYQLTTAELDRLRDVLENLDPNAYDDDRIPGFTGSSRAGFSGRNFGSSGSDGSKASKEYGTPGPGKAGKENNGGSNANQGYTTIKQANSIYYSDVLSGLEYKVIYKKAGVAVFSVCIPGFGVGVVVSANSQVENLFAYGAMIDSTPLSEVYGPQGLPLFAGLAWLHAPGIIPEANSRAVGAVEFRKLDGRHHVYIGWEGESFIGHVDEDVCMLAGTFHIED